MHGIFLLLLSFSVLPDCHAQQRHRLRDHSQQPSPEDTTRLPEEFIGARFGMDSLTNRSTLTLTFQRTVDIERIFRRAYALDSVVLHVDTSDLSLSAIRKDTICIGAKTAFCQWAFTFPLTTKQSEILSQNEVTKIRLIITTTMYGAAIPPILVIKSYSLKGNERKAFQNRKPVSIFDGIIPSVKR